MHLIFCLYIAKEKGNMKLFLRTLFIQFDLLKILLQHVIIFNTVCEIFYIIFENYLLFSCNSVHGILTQSSHISSNEQLCDWLLATILSSIVSYYPESLICCGVVIAIFHEKHERSWDRQ